MSAFSSIDAEHAWRILQGSDHEILLIACRFLTQNMTHHDLSQ